jgi:hypothetical protein
VLLVGLILALATGRATAESGTPDLSQDQFFSGTVKTFEGSRITVTRTVLGKPSATRTFIISSETRIEGGQPEVKARVTVRFITTENGDQAVHIIVRSKK